MDALRKSLDTISATKKKPASVAAGHSIAVRRSALEPSHILIQVTWIVAKPRWCPHGAKAAGTTSCISDRMNCMSTTACCYRSVNAERRCSNIRMLNRCSKRVSRRRRPTAMKRRPQRSPRDGWPASLAVGDAAAQGVQTGIIRGTVIDPQACRPSVTVTASSPSPAGPAHHDDRRRWHLFPSGSCRPATTRSPSS